MFRNKYSRNITKFFFIYTEFALGLNLCISLVVIQALWLTNYHISSYLTNALLSVAEFSELKLFSDRVCVNYHIGHT